MKLPHNPLPILLAAALAAALCPTAGAAERTSGVSLHERLSTLEEPLAIEVGDLTFLATGAFDTPYTLELDGDSPYVGTGTFAEATVSARTQLANRWRVGVTWLARYADNAPDVEGPQGEYEDHLAMSVGGSWGLLHFGDVSRVIYQQTRRQYGAGYARLRLDDAFGKLDDLGAAYQVRLGPWLVGAATDEASNVDVGATFQRPSGVRDYRLTARYSDSVCRSPVGVLMDSKALSGVGEFIYGSTLVDFGAGVEQLSAPGANADRWYVSSGVRHKTGVLTWSIEGHAGRIASNPEKSVALGLQYDIARGLAVNFGINYAESSAIVGDAELVDIDGTQGVVSLRYGF